MLWFLIKIICKCILYITGWKDTVVMSKKVPEKSVIIFPHSSYFDYLIFSMYTFAFTSQFQNLNFYVLMSERFSWMFCLSRSIIAVPDKYVRHYMEVLQCSHAKAVFEAYKNEILSFVSKKYSLTAKENIKSDTVSYICDKLKNKSHFSLLISPTGSITNTQWKSGYLYIAKQLNVPVTVAGINYKEKQLYFLESFNVDDDFNEAVVKEEFEKIGRLGNNKLIDYPTFTSFVSSVLLIPNMFSVNIFMGFLTLLASVVSFYYHYTMEKCFAVLDIITANVLLICLLYLSWDVKCHISLVICFCLSTFYYGRSFGNCRPRSNNYTINHSKFHLFFAISCSILLNTLSDHT